MSWNRERTPYAGQVRPATGTAASVGDLLEGLSLAMWDLRDEIAAAEREVVRLVTLDEQGQLSPDARFFVTALQQQNERMRGSLAALWVDYAALRADGAPDTA